MDPAASFLSRSPELMSAADTGLLVVDVQEKLMVKIPSAQAQIRNIAFLIDGERSAFVNGVSLPVDGGWIADASWDGLRLRTRG